MRTLGEQERRIRCFLGLSQEELAHLAGVSQGSVSRLESGRGLATPMLVGAKVSAVLRRALTPWASLLNDNLRRSVDRWHAALPAEDAVLQLVERLDAAKRAETERKALAGEAEKVARRLGEKRERRQALEDTIDALLRAADAPSAEEFEAAARAASRAAGIAEEMRVLERELRMIRGSEDEAGFLAELDGADGDTIAGERERLREEITDADEKRQDVLREAGIARKSVDDLEAGDAMSRLSLELESLRSELAESCDEWAPLVLTRALIGRALKKFEREHQPAMLREVARREGYRASFTPKVAPDKPGNGAHIHFSLQTRDGKPITYDAAGPGGLSDRALQFAAGIVRHTPALCAFTAL